MCGRYRRTSDKQRIAEAFQIGADLADYVLAPDGNIAPTSVQPVVRLDRDTENRQLVAMRWGMIPFFAKDAKKFRTTFNARAETLSTQPMWREPLKKRRCLVPCDGFFEWQKITDKLKRKFEFSVKGQTPFAFAGLWDAWKDPVNGEWLQSFTIVTTDANELMAPIHIRMPVILHPRDYDRWLSRDESERLPVDLLRPFESDEMSSEACDPAVGPPTQLSLLNSE